MLLTYLDESYDNDFYWMAALLCQESALQPLAEKLDTIVRRTAAQHGVPPDAELHGHDLFQGKADWEPMGEMVQARIGVYRAVFEAVGQADVRIILRGLDRKRHESRYGEKAYHPHRVVIEHLLERVDELAEANDELVLVIADQIDNEDVYRQNLWEFQRWNTAGYRARQLTRIVDTLHFVPSRRSRLVQATDMIAFMRRRMKSTAPQHLRVVQANRRLWDLIAPKISHDRCWVA